MRTLRANEVFKPGAFPEHTYVSRMPKGSNYTYEFRLEQALNTIGFLTSIIGPSKTGKTVLCEKVIGIPNIIALSGNDFKKDEPFWTTIAKKAGMSIEGEQIQSSMLEGDRTGGLSESRGTSLKEKYITNKDRVIEFFKKHNLVLLLDDFHYAPTDMQYDMAHQLKDAIRKEFRTIVISLPHRADDAIRKNADLSGRLNLINIEAWQEMALKEIAITGFSKLGVEINDILATDLAAESLTSPQLMQSICLNLSIVLNLDHDDQINEITEHDHLIEAYKITTLNLPYMDVIKRLKTGPPSRGQKRKTFEIIGGEQLDIYELLLRVFALDPPIISISLDELKRRIDQLLGNLNAKPDRNKIRSTIEQVQIIMESSESIYQVFEWKDNEIYILDPLFLFYLRWNN